MYKKLSLFIEALTLSNDSGMGKINRIYLSAFLQVFHNQRVCLLTREKIPIKLPSGWSLKITRARPFRLWIEWVFPVILFKEKPELVICLGMNIPKLRPRSRYFMLVHDMSPMENLPFRASLYEEENKKMFPVMLSRADYILTNSQFTKSRIEKLTPKAAKDIFVFPPLSEQAFELKPKREMDVLSAVPPKSPYFFSCGNLEPRKNFPGLIFAYQLAYEADSHLPPLYIAGHKAWGYQDIVDTLESLTCKDKVLILGRISNESLTDFIKSCTLFISSSLYEGWGFPLFEAMLAGRPSLYHLESSQKEFAENFSLGINMADTELLADTIVSLWNNPQKREEMEKNLKGPFLLSKNTLEDRMQKAFSPFLPG